MKVRKSAVTLGVLVLLGMVIVSGCGPVTVETPVPTPDINAAVETAIAAVMTSQPTPNATATYVAIATEIAVTQAAQVEQVATPTPVPPTATPEPTDTPVVGPTDTPILTDTPTVPCVSPTIEFTYVPPYGHTYEDLKGRVACVEPADYKVAVYIYVDGGWFNKPFLASPLTIIGSDGAWTTDITLAPNDPRATQIAAFLVRNGYSPSLMEGETMFPEELYKNSVGCAMADREPDARIIDFSGHT
jgi:hypothetical protein